MGTLSSIPYFLAKDYKKKGAGMRRKFEAFAGAAENNARLPVANGENIEYTLG